MLRGEVESGAIAAEAVTLKGHPLRPQILAVRILFRRMKEARALLGEREADKQIISAWRDELEGILSEAAFLPFGVAGEPERLWRAFLRTAQRFPAAVALGEAQGFHPEVRKQLNAAYTNAEKAYKLAETLEKTLIINEDGRNTDSMLEEGLTNMDAFVAVTGRSETNILAALLAKRMGVKKVIAEVENLNYISLAESMGIDTIINKKLITASNIFRFTMSTDVQAIKCLTGSDAEVLEFIVKPNSPATKAKIKDLDFPRNAMIGGIVRGDKIFIAEGGMEINAYDRVVVFALPDAIARIGKYFN